MCVCRVSRLHVSLDICIHSRTYRYAFARMCVLLCRQLDAASCGAALPSALASHFAAGVYLSFVFARSLCHAMGGAFDMHKLHPCRRYVCVCPSFDFAVLLGSPVCPVAYCVSAVCSCLPLRALRLVNIPLHAACMHWTIPVCMIESRGPAILCLARYISETRQAT